MFLNLEQVTATRVASGPIVEKQNLNQSFVSLDSGYTSGPLG